MLEEEIFVIFTLMALGIVIVKLVNVLQLGQFYDPEWSLVTFIVHGVSFMFLFLMTLNGAAADVSLVSYIWGHIVLFSITSILFVIEVLLWFVYMIPKKAGSEKYGDRGRLTIQRERW